MAVFFISQVQFGQAVTAATCAQIRDAWGLTMPVVYDPTGQLNSQFGMQDNGGYLVMKSGGQIVKKGTHPSNASMSNDIQGALNSN